MTYVTALVVKLSIDAFRLYMRHVLWWYKSLVTVYLYMYVVSQQSTNYAEMTFSDCKCPKCKSSANDLAHCDTFVNN